jgi:hypothetical protein
MLAAYKTSYTNRVKKVIQQVVGVCERRFQASPKKLVIANGLCLRVSGKMWSPGRSPKIPLMCLM